MSPIGFAHRGGKADAPENTLPAFRKALANGATGLESDVLVTSDGVPVLVHDDDYWSWWPPLRHFVSKTARADLPTTIPTLGALFEMRAGVDIFLDLKATEAATLVTKAARQSGTSSRLWLAHESHKTSDRATVASWRALDADVRLVDSSNFSRLSARFVPYVEELSEIGIDALNLPAKHWTADRVDICRSHGLSVLAFGAHSHRSLKHAISLGVDGVFSDHTKRMMQAINRYGRSSS